ncbi:hypothetical protein [Streptomyces lydicus]|uniref:hypothetical protein n=1 Tax=Streptomyces lydicus TaxID=47763 RepID=UPI0037AD6F3D
MTIKHFAKGYGTENDFVILPDPDGRLDMATDDVIRLCLRHPGHGADGILRAARYAADPKAAPMADSAECFMTTATPTAPAARCAVSGPATWRCASTHEESARPAPAPPAPPSGHATVGPHSKAATRNSPAPPSPRAP